MPSEKNIKKLVLWLIFIIFVSFSLAVVLFILSGDNWFKSEAACQVQHLQPLIPPLISRIS